eukprot:Amastigsp_a843053_21.p5 type:complete len:101 gc:universal Amastigsp_a843053_21:668-970(+)
MLQTMPSARMRSASPAVSLSGFPSSRSWRRLVLLRSASSTRSMPLTEIAFSRSESTRRNVLLESAAGSSTSPLSPTLLRSRLATTSPRFVCSACDKISSP